MGTDPFAAKDAPADPTYSKQIHGVADFFDAWLKGKGRPPAKSIRYDVLNGGGWHTSAAWPPSGVKDVEIVFRRRPHVVRGRARPRQRQVQGRFRRRARAATAATSRRSISRAPPIPIARRRTRSFSPYTGAKLAADVEIAGNPVAHLTLASSAADEGSGSSYLEAVSPKGAVTYLAEGVLRLAHRKESAGTVPSGDPLHTHLAAGRFADDAGQGRGPIQIALSPIAVRLRKGERLRVAIAGADADNLQRIPAQGDVTLTLMRGVSSVTLPVMQ